MTRYITTWRKEAPNQLDHDYYVSNSLTEAEAVVRNLKARGVHQFTTSPIGGKVAELSSEY